MIIPLPSKQEITARRFHWWLLLGPLVLGASMPDTGACHIATAILFLVAIHFCSKRDEAEVARIKAVWAAWHEKRQARTFEQWQAAVDAGGD